MTLPDVPARSRSRSVLSLACCPLLGGMLVGCLGGLVAASTLPKPQMTP